VQVGDEPESSLIRDPLDDGRRHLDRYPGLGCAPGC
jgi:hypothetical protein